MPSLIPRHAEATVEDLLTVFPAVVLTGARQVGKSTLAQMICGPRAGTYLTLDELATRTHALSDPEGFAAGLPAFAVIDEIQLAPELLRALKLTIDRKRSPGRFLLTGSANLLRMRSVGESLAGRSGWFDLLGLTSAELGGFPAPSTLDHAFASRDAGRFLSTLTLPLPKQLQAARALAVEGGMPATLGMRPAERHAWYKGYRQTFVERDLRQLSRIEDLPGFLRLFTLAALRSGGLLNKSTLAGDAGLTHPTVRRYLDVLEVADQFFELQPFHVNLAKRLVKTPKLYARDVGLVAHIANINSWNDAESRGHAGALLETWAINELLAMDRLSGNPATCSFFRTSTGREVDLVLERGNDVVAFEIKASATVRTDDTAGLRELRDAVGKRFKLGVVAHLGDRPTPLDRNLCAAPLPSLLGAAG